jgi:hypothetical protein
LDPTWLALGFGLFVPVVALIGGLVIAALAIHHKAKLKELAYRERIAMIEKGLMPPPESDPARFDRVLDNVAAPADPAATAARHRAAGIITIGAGLAVMLLLYFVTGESRIAFGLGGATVLLGLAFIVTSVVVGGAKTPT